MLLGCVPEAFAAGTKCREAILDAKEGDTAVTSLEEIPSCHSADDFVAHQRMVSTFVVIGTEPHVGEGADAPPNLWSRRDAIE
jgi:hypothetical protein